VSSNLLGRLRKRLGARRLCLALHKRIDSGVHGRHDDATARNERTRDESHRDVQAAYRDRDYDLLAAYDRYLSAPYGTVHARFAAEALRTLDRRASLDRDLTPELVNTAGRVCAVLRENNVDFALSLNQKAMTTLTAAVMKRPECEYALLDLVAQNGVPQENGIRKLLDESASAGQLFPDAL
jgi:hypothetical protein